MWEPHARDIGDTMVRMELKMEPPGLRSTRKTCFFVSRIGEENSEERKFSDDLLAYIIDPVVGPLGYAKPIRADDITKPGTITSQVFDHLWTADLVVADLTGANPNVFYELAVRHLSKKPFVQMILKGEKLPFDVAPERTIHFGFDVQFVESTKKQLGAMVKSAEEGPCENSLSRAIEYTFVKNDVPVGKAMILDILSHLQQIENQLEQRQPARLFGQIAEQNRRLTEESMAVLSESNRYLRGSTLQSPPGMPQSEPVFVRKARTKEEKHGGE
jgi:hypothetical protein